MLIPRDPLVDKVRFTDGENIATGCLGVTMVAVGPLIALSINLPFGWLSWLLLPLAYVYANRRWRQARAQVYNFSGSYVKDFMSEWRRLDRPMRIELSDLYMSVLRVAESIDQMPDVSYGSPIYDEVIKRTTAVRKVADEIDENKRAAITTSIVLSDDHALQTAQLYVEAFRKQRME